jgi:DNA-binding beta-propeller fold protein YncE
MSPLARVAVAVCAATLALAAGTAQASLLSPSGSFGSQGSGNGQFQGPLGVAVQQSSGNVFVVDSQNARVEKFDANGNFIAAFGQAQLTFPGSIATDNLGKVYVADVGPNTVVKFDAKGNFVSTIDGSAAPQGHFQNIAGIAVDQAGNLWVADGSTSNVVEFDSKGEFLLQWNDSHGSPSSIAVDSGHNAVYLITQGTTEPWRGSVLRTPRRWPSIAGRGTSTSITAEIGPTSRSMTTTASRSMTSRWGRTPTRRGLRSPRCRAAPTSPDSSASTCPTLATTT